VAALAPTLLTARLNSTSFEIDVVKRLSTLSGQRSRILKVCVPALGREDQDNTFGRYEQDIRSGILGSRLPLLGVVGESGFGWVLKQRELQVSSFEGQINSDLL